MTEHLRIADLVTRFTYYPSLTIDDRYRINYTFDLDFNLPGDWYIRTSLFETTTACRRRACRRTTGAGPTPSASSSEDDHAPSRQPGRASAGVLTSNT